MTEKEELLKSEKYVKARNVAMRRVMNVHAKEEHIDRLTVRLSLVHQRHADDPTNLNVGYSALLETRDDTNKRSFELEEGKWTKVPVGDVKSPGTVCIETRVGAGRTVNQTPEVLAAEAKMRVLVSIGIVDDNTGLEIPAAGGWFGHLRPGVTDVYLCAVGGNIPVRTFVVPR